MSLAIRNGCSHLCVCPLLGPFICNILHRWHQVQIMHGISTQIVIETVSLASLLGAKNEKGTVPSSWTELLDQKGEKSYLIAQRCYLRISRLFPPVPADELSFFLAFNLNLGPTFMNKTATSPGKTRAGVKGVGQCAIAGDTRLSWQTPLPFTEFPRIQWLRTVRARIRGDMNLS